MKSCGSSTVCLMRHVSGQSSQETLEAEAAEMRQRDSIKNLDAKQRSKERAPGKQKMRQNMQIEAGARASSPKFYYFFRLWRNPYFSKISVALANCVAHQDQTLLDLVLDLPEKFWG